MLIYQTNTLTSGIKEYNYNQTLAGFDGLEMKSIPLLAYAKSVQTPGELDGGCSSNT